MSSVVLTTTQSAPGLRRRRWVEQRVAVIDYGVLLGVLFLLGLGLFGLGVSLQMLLSLLEAMRQHLCTLSVATIGVMTAVVTVVTLVLALWKG